MMRTPVEPESEIRRTIYGMDGIALGFLRERRSWEDRIPAEEDEIGTSGSKDGTWKMIDDDGRFPSLVDLFLRHGGSLETVEELIRGVKARVDQEMENWCPDWIRIRASTNPCEPNIILDDRKEAEKVGARRGAPPLDEAYGGAPVRRCKQQARASLLCKCSSVLNPYRAFGFVF